MLLQRLRLSVVACLGARALAHVRFVSAVATVDEVTPLAMYRRIHVQDPSEYPLLYDLLESYITKPETAASVKEVVFRPVEPRDCCYFTPPPDVEEWREAEVSRNASSNSVFYQGIERLGLSGREKDRWVKILTWMAPEVREQRRRPEEFDLQEHFDKFVRKQDHEFANHATALLLTLCPNVERLVYGDNEDLNLVKMILRRNNYGALPEPNLQNLKEVTLLGNDDILFGDERFYIGVDILQLMRMFHRLPKIESLSAHAMDSPHEYATTFPARTSNVKKINITHSVFGSEVLVPLIRAPKALEELTITTGGRCTIDGTAIVVGEEIGKALLTQRESLVKLDLDLGWVWTPTHTYEEDEEELDDYESQIYAEGEWEQLALNEAEIDKREMLSQQQAPEPDNRVYEASIGSLHDFERLTHLSFNVQHFGYANPRIYPPPSAPSQRLVDLLPPNLEYLLLRGYKTGVHEGLDSQVAELLQLRLERFPALKAIDGIDEFISEGKHVERPDENEHLLWKADDVDPTWHLHTHDEL